MGSCGKRSREKGKRYEQHVARRLRLDGFAVSRNSNQAHPNAVDEDPKGDLLGLRPFSDVPIHVQAKKDERKSIWAMLAQAIADAPIDFIPALFFSRNHDRDYVALTYEDFIFILQRAADSPHRAQGYRGSA